MKNLILARIEKLFYYSPYNFINSVTKNNHLSFIHDIINDYINEIGFKKKFKFENDKGEYLFLYEYLDWDSNYFELKTFKLYTVLYQSIDLNNLKLAVKAFNTHIQNVEQADYCFCEIPSEDITLIQALTSQQFQLTETRLTFFCQNLQQYEFGERYPVRSATLNDIDNLKLVASKMRNDFDRFHADEIFSLEKADAFLGTYIENAVKGYCDLVIVPNLDFGQPDAFVAANYLKHDWHKTKERISRIVLTAVLSDTRKGWHSKLISEITYKLKEAGADTVLMTTQSTNRAVFKTCKKLGYTLGSTTHIFSISNKIN